MVNSIEMQDLSAPSEPTKINEEDPVANNVVSIWSYITASVYDISSSLPQLHFSDVVAQAPPVSVLLIPIPPTVALHI
jgi:hypothetical protein